MSTKKILAELFALDPKLKEQEKELKKIISEMLKHKPEILQDEEYKQHLLEELLQTNNNLSFKKNNMNIFKKIAIMLGGTALAAFALMPYINNSNPSNLPGEEISFLTNEIAESEEDFALDVEDNVAQLNESLHGNGGGRGGAEMMASDKAISSIMPYPGRSNYTYKYQGEDLELKEEKLPVIKAEEMNMEIDYASLFKNVEIDALKLDQFKDLKIANVSFEEEGDNAYRINLNLKNGQLNINKIWDTWEEFQKDEYVIDKYNVTDKDIIKVANSFIKEYGINLKNYGEAELLESPKIFATREYKPDSYQVVYPLLVEGKKVMTNWGNLVGVSVSVDLRTGKVSDFYGFEPKTYTSKQYPAVTDFGKIKELVDKTGDSKFAFEEETEEEIVKVKKPEQVWLEYRSYSNNSSKLYLVPALAFENEYPESEKDTWISRRKTVLPLISEMLEKMGVEK